MNKNQGAQPPFSKKIFENKIKWMTIKDTAKYLSRSENAIRILVHRGTLPSYKLGRRVYLRRSEIDNLLVTSRLDKGGFDGH